ncbi:hypothetical protein ACFOWZ_01460 [Lentzea rhizosphaerae]|uniref:Uncharacterized protein n=1 Tax=Lentzea rhizosphaerae TaxID=2041025 RepID=A0ABV8BLW5_9PSEU
MGEFVAASAFETEDVVAVLTAVSSFLTAHSWPAVPVEDAESAAADEVQIFPPTNGWTVVLWPHYFTEVAAAEHMSRELGVLTSTARIYDGDYWTHSLLRNGVTLDRFASMPDYFTDDVDEVVRLVAKYAGRSEVIADATGCPVEQLAPYLVRIGEDEDSDDEVEPARAKAFPDDEFELDSPWVFVDFWRRFGPYYPEDLSQYAARLRLAPGWLDKLPSGDPEL